jgi:hypothetical protein
MTISTGGRYGASAGGGGSNGFTVDESDNATSLGDVTIATNKQLKCFNMNMVSTGVNNIFFTTNSGAGNRADMVITSSGSSFLFSQNNNGNIDFGKSDRTVDAATSAVRLKGQNAASSATTNQDGGDVEIVAGTSASGGGSDGSVLLRNIATADPTIADAVWVDGSGFLRLSAG